MIQKIFTSSTLLQIYEQTMKEKRNAKDEENNQSPTKMGPRLTNDMMKNI